MLIFLKIIKFFTRNTQLLITNSLHKIDFMCIFIKLKIIELNTFKLESESESEEYYYQASGCAYEECDEDCDEDASGCAYGGCEEECYEDASGDPCEEEYEKESDN